MYRILIVEDDLTIASALAAHLRKWDYEADYVEDFKNVMERFGAVDPQLVILDIGLPFFNGFYWCQQIRQVSQVPIIFLSSLDDNMNIVMAMNMGGDEFIEKPFDLNVVTAKVQALLRRSYSFGTSSNLIEYPGQRTSEDPDHLQDNFQTGGRCICLHLLYRCPGQHAGADHNGQLRSDRYHRSCSSASGLQPQP